MKKFRVAKLNDFKTSKTGHMFCIASLQDIQTLETYTAYLFPEGVPTDGMLGKVYPMEMEKLNHPYGNIHWRARIVGPAEESVQKPDDKPPFAAASQTPQAGTEDRIRSFALSYAKDILCAVLSAGGDIHSVPIWQYTVNFEKYLRSGSVPLLEQLKQLQEKPEQNTGDEIPF